jgi:hypothetical protein
MTLPKPVEALWDELQGVRASLLAEVDGLSQRQADWKPSEREWSIGEILHHLTLAEVATGKLTTKLVREADAGGVPAVFPHDLTAFAALPERAAGPAEAPAPVWPTHGRPIGELRSGLVTTRARSRESIEKLARVDPRRLVFMHFRLGDLDLAQWWRLQAEHDAVHLEQIRHVKRAPGFPAP